MENKRTINKVLVAESAEQARTLALNIFSEYEVDGVFSSETSDSILKGYIRAPDNEHNNKSPLGVTDVLVGQYSSYSESASYVKDYIRIRTDIPNKILFTDSLNDDERNALKVDVHLLDKTNDSSIRELNISTTVELERTLREAFNTFDTNKNGFIEAKEIVEVSKVLDHEINEQEALRIVQTLSKDGKVDFEGFKKWWIFGKSDFSMFRIVIKSETASNKLMKNAALNFANYLNEIEAEEGYSKSTGKIMIGNEKAIDAQIGVSIESNFGVALESLVDSMPSHYRKKVGTIALGLTLNDQSLG